MTDSPTPETPRLSPLDVTEAFIAQEVGWHAPAMRDQAQALLDAYADAGFVVVRVVGDHPLTHGDELAVAGTLRDMGILTRANRYVGGELVFRQVKP